MKAEERMLNWIVLKGLLAVPSTDTTRLKVYQSLFDHYLNRNNDSSLHYAEQALSLAHTVNEPGGLIKPLYNLGLVYEHLGQFQTGLDYYQQALDQAEELSDTVQMLTVYTGFGRINKRMYNHDKALEYYMKVLEFAPEEEVRLRAITLNNIGGVYEDLGQNEEAIPFYEQALVYHRQTGVDRNIGGSLMGLGIVHMNLGDYDRARELLEESQVFAERSGNKILLSILFEHRGNLSRALKDYDQALEHYNQSMELAEEMDDQYGVSSVALHLGTIHQLRGECELAVPFLEQSVALGEDEGFTKYLDQAYRLLAYCAAEAGLYDRAYDYHQKYASLRDSLFEVNRTQQILELETRYEMQQKELEIASLQQEQQLNERISQALQLALLASLVAGILIAGFFFYRSRTNERLARLKQEQVKFAEEAYSNLKTTQDQLIHSEKMASLGELTAGIAHEIQNPLNFVNNFSDVNKELVLELEEEIEKGNKEEVMSILGDIRENEEKITHHGKRAEGIVKSMLQHSRSGDGSKELVDINALADEYLRLAYHGFRAKDKSFNCEIATAFDPSKPHVMAVPQEIGRVLLNLISNAFQALSSEGPGDGSPKVTVGTTTDNSTVHISVEDNGPGIPEEIKDKIFQPFFTTKETGVGTGLGLSLSYDIITKGHGGKLGVESTPGEGTRFLVELPLKS